MCLHRGDGSSKKKRTMELEPRVKMTRMKTCRFTSCHLVQSKLGRQGLCGVRSTPPASPNSQDDSDSVGYNRMADYFALTLYRTIYI